MQNIGRERLTIVISFLCWKLLGRGLRGGEGVRLTIYYLFKIYYIFTYIIYLPSLHVYVFTFSVISWRTDFLHSYITYRLCRSLMSSNHFIRYYSCLLLGIISWCLFCWYVIIVEGAIVVWCVCVCVWMILICGGVLMLVVHWEWYVGCCVELPSRFPGLLIVALCFPQVLGFRW